MKTRSLSVMSLLEIAKNRYLQSVNGKSKKNVLFVGPGGFHPGIWENRVKYILPDLFEAIKSDANIYMLTAPVPDFAKSGIRALKNRFNVSFFEVKAKSNVSHEKKWTDNGTNLAFKINADIITNIFGSVQFPDRVVKIAKKSGAQAIVRVAGDEISSRILMGKYRKNDEQHKEDLQVEKRAFLGADRIMAMSPWEKKRIENICLKPGKVGICYRGVDLNVFAGSEKRTTPKITTFLYVGRKSLEKGFQLVENAALLLQEKFPDVEFLFAGNFEIKAIGNRKYLGFIESKNLPELYRRSHVVILCSENEGMPQVVTEAMAMSKPCILSKSPFSTWIGDENVALFSDLSAEGIAKAVVKYHEDPGLARIHAVNARQFAERNFARLRGQEKYRNMLLGI